MKNISIKKILSQLESGMSRDEIVADINASLPEDDKLNPEEIKVLWAHEKLKGVKKRKYKVQLTFTDDSELEVKTDRTGIFPEAGDITDTQEARAMEEGF